MASLQKAVVVDSNGNVSLQHVSIPEPGPGEILIKTVTAAQNPSDWMASQRAKVAGAIIGFDFAGTVERIGPDVPLGTRTVGERVAGWIVAGYTPNGAFAEYLVARADYVVAIPESWSSEEAAQLGICPYTALQALYESIEGLPTPDAPATDNEPILIYGGSTAVGIFAVQFAKLAGLRVLATASPANFELVKKLGADEVFDYKDPEVVKKIRDATGGKLKAAVDCVATKQTIALVVDTIGEEGGNVAAVLPVESPRENVRVKFSLVFEWYGRSYEVPYPFTATPEHKARGLRFLKLFSDLLHSGKIKLGPIRIMPNGLAGVPDGIRYMLDGKVSGQKLVYRISDTPEQ